MKSVLFVERENQEVEDGMQQKDIAKMYHLKKQANELIAVLTEQTRYRTDKKTRQLLIVLRVLLLRNVLYCAVASLENSNCSCLSVRFHSRLSHSAIILK